MSDNPRKKNGQLNPKFKKLINEELSNLSSKIKRADKEYSKIAALTTKATKESKKPNADADKIKKAYKHFNPKPVKVGVRHILKTLQLWVRTILLLLV